MYKSYRRLIVVLRKRLPPAFPVDARRVSMKNLDGSCQRRGEKFYIRVNRKLPETAAIDALLHEWAHARAWNHLHDNLTPEEFKKVVHDAAWGVAYAEVYRVFEEFNNERPG